MTSPLGAASAPHGSPAGSEAGCRTRAMCPHGPDSELLSCAEAVVRRRGDYHLLRLPADQPLPRHGNVGVMTSSREPVRAVHGTPWGYARGCRDARACPNRLRGAMTCAEARRRYVQEYSARRATGAGTPIEHGTPNGYLLGCRDGRLCPGGGDGVSCAEARSRHRMRIARAAGIAPRAETLDAAPAIAKVRALRSQGWSLRRISSATGCGRTTIAELTGEAGAVRARITPVTLRRILAVQP